VDKKYVRLMESYLEKIKPNVGEAWRTDELYLKVKGNMKYLYVLMDDGTRFWIAQQVADSKYTANFNPLFKEDKEVTGKRPNTLISDGARNFGEAFNKEFLELRNGFVPSDNSEYVKKERKENLPLTRSLFFIISKAI
jgi:putative transposase